MSKKNSFSLYAALAVVIANMVGTGVFTSLGYQVIDIESGFLILLLWSLGGIAALCGALCYAELGAALPRSGGEYNFLSRIFHPSVGFLGGWVSATIGFAAPIAIVALLFAKYITPEDHLVTTAAERIMAASLIISLALVHSRTRNTSAGMQTFLTGFKILVILLFSVLGIAFAPELQGVSFMPSSSDVAHLNFGAFAVSLVYVGYAYTGWNAATYLTGELENPQKVLPRVLVSGTLIVMALYLLLNAVFLLVAPIDALKGVAEVGRVAAVFAFGDVGGQLAGFVFAALLISTVSAMTVAGPRVLQIIGEDISAFRALSVTNDDGIPSRAIWVQTALALVFVSAGSFEQVLLLTGFTLSLVSLATVIGAVVLRFTQPGLSRPFRIPLFPLPPIGFIAIIGWTLSYTMLERPIEALFAAILLTAGLIVYGATRLLGRAE